MNKEFNMFRPGFRTAIQLFTTTPWRWGWEHWNGKPKFWIGFSFYDWWHFDIHIGNFWLECSHMWEREDDNKFGFIAKTRGE